MNRMILIVSGMILLIGCIIKICIMITEGRFRNYQRI